MTVIAISKFRPHAGKANLVLQNMKDVASEFDKMGYDCKNIARYAWTRCRMPDLFFISRKLYQLNG